MSKKRIIVLSAILVVVAGVVTYRFWSGSNVKNKAIPFDIFLEHAVSDDQYIEEDVSGDHLPETYILSSGRLTVTQAGEELWQTPSEWWVDHFEIADTTSDGQMEIALSVWKSGSYGTSKPFWVSEEDKSVKNHFFVFGFKDQKIQPIWQSSNLSRPNCEFIIADVNGDGMDELVVIEGEYSSDFICSGKYLAVWSWQEWGFYNDWRSEAGEYEGALSQEYLDQIIEVSKFWE